MRSIVLFVLMFMLCSPVHAGFRYGTKLIVEGDSISRLLKACGKPATKYKSRQKVGKGRSGKAASVTNWIYERGRKKSMRVIVYNGKVAGIELDR